jgi:hypothetical protein
MRDLSDYEQEKLVDTIWKAATTAGLGAWEQIEFANYDDNALLELFVLLDNRSEKNAAKTEELRQQLENREAQRSRIEDRLLELKMLIAKRVNHWATENQWNLEDKV